MLSPSLCLCDKGTVLFDSVFSVEPDLHTAIMHTRKASAGVCKKQSLLMPMHVHRFVSAGSKPAG